jgi:hypothetical protein
MVMDRGLRQRSANGCEAVDGERAQPGNTCEGDWNGDVF